MGACQQLAKGLNMGVWVWGLYGPGTLMQAGCAMHAEGAGTVMVPRASAVGVVGCLVPSLVSRQTCSCPGVLHWCTQPVGACAAAMTAHVGEVQWLRDWMEWTFSWAATAACLGPGAAGSCDDTFAGADGGRDGFVQGRNDAVFGRSTHHVHTAYKPGPVRMQPSRNLVPRGSYLHIA
jgi:hypothetical protein